MPKSAVLPVRNGQLRRAVNAFLQELLRRGAVQAVLALLSHKAGSATAEALVTDPSLLENADVLAPVLPVNAARGAR